MLLTVAILGIAAMFVIPSMGDSDTLRVQAALRVIVADITFAQSDAMAFQQRRAIVFDAATNSYAIYEVNGSTIDPANDLLDSNFGVGGQYIRNLNDPTYAGAQMSDISFSYAGTLAFGTSIMIFDELGGPVDSLVGNGASLGGYIEVTGNDQTYRVNVDAYTGRVTVQRMP